MCLVSIVERISDVTEKTLTELCLSHRHDASEIEDMESLFAGEVATMGQVTLELLHFLFQVDLVEEEAGHFFAYFVLIGLLGVRNAAHVCIASPTELARGS